MARQSPLTELHHAHAARTAREVASAPRAAPAAAEPEPDLEMIPYGPSPGDEGDDPGEPVEIVGTYGYVEPEYGALRKGAGVLDRPDRGTLRIVGGERRDFLNRMLTQELKDLEPGVAKTAFWLNRKGRIEADLLLGETGDALFVDLDVHRAARTKSTLESFIFAEDVAIEDVSDAMHRIALHGPDAAAALAHASGDDAFAPEPLTTRTLRIGSAETVVTRRDQIGEPGFELILPWADAETVWTALVESERADRGKRRVRPVGWYAFNIARIEAGTPLFNVDFGPNNLPHETGVLRDRVSFRKGCYLGQEIVARMESLGRPKQTLVGLAMRADRLPVAGAQVFTAGDDPGDADATGNPVGVVTSSTLSPMLGARPIAFAMVRTKHADPGATLKVNAEGGQAEATVTGLRFWPPPDSTTRDDASGGGA